jgi:O-antigen/teichoic acid export membrane protein
VASSAVWVDGLLRRLVRNSSWGLASTAIEFVLSLVETTLVARALGAADYGRLALVVASVVSIKQLIDVRAWEGATRYLAEFLERDRPALALATLKLALMADAAVAVVAYGTTVALAGLAGTRLLHQPNLSGLIAWYALTLLLTAVNSTAEALLRVFDRFRDLGVRVAVQAVWHLGLVAAVVTAGGRLRGLIFAYLVSDLAGAALLALLAGRQVRRRLWPVHARAALATLRPYRREMIWFTVQTAIRATFKLSRHVDLLVLGAFRPPAEVGYYRVARRLGTAVVDLTNPFYFAIFPEFARAWAGTRRRFARLLARIAGAAVTGAALVVLLSIWLAPHVIQGWVGPQYAPAVGPFRIIMVAMGMAIATFWVTPAALGTGRPEIATYGVAAGVSVYLALVFLLVPHHGPMGAALSLVGGYLALGLVTSTLLGRALLGSRRPAVQRRRGSKSGTVV